MKASDVMSSPVITVRPDTPVRALAALLAERRISGVPVLEGERLVGIVSEADLLRRPRGARPPARRARDIMTREVETVAPGTPLAEIAALLEGRGIKRVPVLQQGQLVGIVSRSNLVQALAAQPAAQAPAAPDDDAIRAALLAELERQPWWRPADANVIVTDGVVRYWGSLDAEDQRELARAAALNLPGVQRVEDHRFPARAAATAGREPATQIRRAAERGHSKHGLVEVFHSFSFGNYYDPAHTAYGPVRAINEKCVQAGAGSTTYGQRNVEVVTYVLEGAFGHEDSLDNSATVIPGGVQRISAGSGVRRSELNRLESGPTRFLQIWLEPEHEGGIPAHEQKHFAAHEKRGRLRLIASPDGREDSLRIDQDAFLYAGLFDGGERAELNIEPGRRSYVHVARGRTVVNGHPLGEGDALKTGGGALAIENGQGAEVLVFDLP
jgi:redox-sensitive bicupin YhaK (pirin superfamily)/CBS domain-containing protein